MNPMRMGISQDINGALLSGIDDQPPKIEQ